jgi:hypothetical protein
MYDYDLVTQKRNIIGMACVVNALEALEDSDHSQELQRVFLVECLPKLEEFSPEEAFVTAPHLTSTAIIPSADVFEQTQDRLWSLYIRSAQVEDEDDGVLPLLQTGVIPHHHCNSQPDRCPSTSPASLKSKIHGVGKNECCAHSDDEGIAAATQHSPVSVRTIKSGL